MSEKPADEDHPFGHGRIEYISSLFVSLAILLMGYELLKAAIGKIITPEAVSFNVTSFAILLSAVIVKLWMFFFNRKIAKKISSAVVMATAKDSLSDCISTTGVLAGLLISQLFDINIDGYIGLIIAVFVLYTGYTTIKDSTEPLLGTTPDAEFVKNEVEKRFGIRNVMVNCLGSVIGSHTGPGTVALFYWGTDKEA